MEHHHDHHQLETSSPKRAFVIGIVLNSVFVIVEFIAGFWQNSLGLLSDAGHNLGDVASLILAMLAFRLAEVHPTSSYTYGFKKSTVLVSLLNAVILLVAVGIIIAESISKFIHPQAVEGSTIAWVAGIGVVINAATAWLFISDKDKDLNIKGAYLHMAADTLVSIGVVVSGIVITQTHWYIVDPIIGFTIALIIIYSTWGLLRNSLRLSLDGVPEGVNTDEIIRSISKIDGIINIHHIHIWAISTTETALTAHVLIKDAQQMSPIKHLIKDKLMEMGIQHVTLEFETEGTCYGGCCS
jgi:cobalt-zinc-cadmium efflux system protein